MSKLGDFQRLNIHPNPFFATLPNSSGSHKDMEWRQSKNLDGYKSFALSHPFGESNFINFISEQILPHKCFSFCLNFIDTEFLSTRIK